MPLSARADGAGDLRHRVRFFERDQVTDDFGNVTTGWLERFTVSANIVPRLGGEAVEAARLAGRQPVVIRVRVSPATVQITTDWKAVDEAGKEYNIRSAVDPMLGDSGHGMFIDMIAETGVAV